MRRLARHLFTLCSAASLLLCVAACVLWVRTYTWMDRLTWTSQPAATPDDAFVAQVAWSVGTDRDVGTVSVIRATKAFKRTDFPGRELDEALDGPGFTQADGARSATPVVGFEPWPPGWLRWTVSEKNPGPYRMVRHQLDIPCWLITLALAVAPAVTAFGRLRRGRRAHHGLCASCGYDLRASPERCPECGVAAAAKGAA